MSIISRNLSNRTLKQTDTKQPVSIGGPAFSRARDQSRTDTPYGHYLLRVARLPIPPLALVKVLQRYKHFLNLQTIFHSGL